jgi:hypothetical protein
MANTTTGWPVGLRGNGYTDVHEIFRGLMAGKYGVRRECRQGYL